MMHKIISHLLLLFTIGLINPVWAQNPDAAAKDPEARKLLDAVKKKYSAYNSIQIKFTYILADRETDVIDEMSGVLDLKDEKFRIEMDEFAMISDNKTVWTYLKSVNQVQIQNYDPELMEQEIGFAPDKVFEVKADDYLYVKKGSKEINGHNCDIVELSPIEKENPVFKIKMYIDKSNSRVHMVEFFETGGVIYKLRLEEETPNKSFSPEHFIFNPSNYTDISIEDLR